MEQKVVTILLVLAIVFSSISIVATIGFGVDDVVPSQKQTSPQEEISNQGNVELVVNKPNNTENETE